MTRYIIILYILMIMILSVSGLFYYISGNEWKGADDARRAWIELSNNEGLMQYNLAEGEAWYLSDKAGRFNNNAIKNFCLIDNYLIGTTMSNSWFICKDINEFDFELFDEETAWEPAVFDLTGRKDLILCSPEALAKKQGVYETKPWQYSIMKGTFGISDVTWALCIAIASLCLQLVSNVMVKEIGFRNKFKIYNYVVQILLMVVFWINSYETGLAIFITIGLVVIGNILARISFMPIIQK